MGIICHQNLSDFRSYKIYIITMKLIKETEGFIFLPIKST